MLRPLLLVLASIFLFAPSGALSFPTEATTLSAGEIKKRLEDRVFDVKLASGVTWRLEYKSNGYFYVNTSQGFNLSGTWSTEDGMLCAQIQGREHSCSEVRNHQDVVHVKRNSGEIIRLVPR